MGQGLGLRACFAFGNDVLAQTDAQGLVGVHPAPGQNQVYGAAFGHQARQAHGAAVDQGDAPSAAIDAHVGGLLHHPDIGPQGEFHPSGHRGSGDGGNHRFRELQPARSHDGHWRLAFVGEIEPVERFGAREGGGVLEVPSRAEGAAFAPEYGNAGGFVGVEGAECFVEGGGPTRVHCVSGFGAGVDYGPDCLARSDDLKAKLEAAPEWGLFVCDEARRMSASFFGQEVRYTKRYQLCALAGRLARHFLLMTATPHNGKEEDFQFFMGLLDADRFEGRFREGVHKVDPSDMMRRLTKEELLRFDGNPLFPERRAYTVSYELSSREAAL